MVGQKSGLAAPCEAHEEDLVLYFYGDLSGAELRHVENHLRECTACAAYVKELGVLLPMTVNPDDPPAPFWDNYSREMRRKLADLEQAPSWWRALATFLKPWAIPALATSAVVALALTFTLGKGVFHGKDVPPDDDSLVEILPIAENLDFFSNMEVLDAMDLLEFMGGQGKSAS